MRTPQRLALGLLSAYLLSGVALAVEVIPFARKPFSDVSASSQFYAAIEYLRKNNVIRGYLDGTFKPDRVITRAEFTQMLTNPFLFRSDWKAGCINAKVPEAATTVFFKDVARDAWYAEAVCTAKVYELIGGYPDGNFKPLRPINFAEAAKISSLVFSLDVTEEAGPKWYEPYVRRLAELKAIPTTITALDKQITRAEMAEIVYRLKTNDTSKTSMTYDQLAW